MHVQTKSIAQCNKTYTYQLESSAKSNHKHQRLESQSPLLESPLFHILDSVDYQWFHLLDSVNYQ